jgi:predicted DsbA family dithiol-disulfide isomerase
VNVVEVYADVRCPFAHAGLRRFVERRDRIAPAVRLRVRSWPLELVNDAPLVPAVIGEEVVALREQVAPDLFAGFEVDRFPWTSLPALGATAAAYDAGLDVGERVALALRWALFEQDRDIARLEVLREVLDAEGVRMPDPRSVRRLVEDDWRRGRALGVIGSPHFFAGDTSHFCPALDIRHEGGELRVVDTQARLDELIDAATR